MIILILIQSLLLIRFVIMVVITIAYCYCYCYCYCFCNYHFVKQQSLSVFGPTVPDDLDVVRESNMVTIICARDDGDRTVYQ